jgi:hypothetical protein
MTKRAAHQRHLGVVGRVGECEGQHALLLQVGLVDAGEGAHYDSAAAEVAGLERCEAQSRVAAQHTARRPRLLPITPNHLKPNCKPLITANP